MSLPSWRKSHAGTVRSTLDCHLIPHLGDIPVGEITKTHILQMRVEIAKRKGRGANATLSAKTINRVPQLLHQALADAADQYDRRAQVITSRKVDGWQTQPEPPCELELDRAA